MNNELQVISISGIDCYEKDGVAYLKLETVARGLGFTRIAESGNEVVRWERVDGYLRDLGVPTCGHDDFIPENIFYRLAMKAKNEAAEAFQAKIADEVIPSIRKTGGYGTPAMFSTLSPQLQALINIEMRQQEHEKRMALMEEKQQHFDDAFKSAMETMAAPTVNRDAWRGEINHSVRQMCAENGLNYQKTISDMYAELEEKAGVSLSRRQANLRERMRIGGAKYAQREAITKLHVIAEDKKLREIYAGIVRQRSARLIAARPQMRH